MKFLALLILTCGFCLSSFAQGTAFTYQGRLAQSAVPYSGNAEIQATLWDAPSDGLLLAANNPQQVVVSVTNGLFVLPLDFGANFPGAGRWLQLEVRTAIGPFTLLTPRQAVTPAPYAIQALNAGTATTLAVPLADQLIPTNVARVNVTNVFSVPQVFAVTTNVAYRFRPEATGFLLDQVTDGAFYSMMSINAANRDVSIGNAGRITCFGNGSVGVDGAFSFEAVNRTADFNANDATCVFFCNTQANNITITLPNATGRLGRIYLIKKINANNTVTIATTGGNTIDGAASIALAANNSYRMVMSNGVNWYVIGQ